GHESWRLNVPYPANVGVMSPPAKGRGKPGKTLILLWFREMTVATAGGPTGPARRRPLDNNPPAAQRNHRPGQCAPQRRARRPYRLVKPFEFAEFDRPFIARVRNEAAEQP